MRRSKEEIPLNCRRTMSPGRSRSEHHFSFRRTFFEEKVYKTKVIQI